MSVYKNIKTLEIIYQTFENYEAYHHHFIGLPMAINPTMGAKSY
jgi:hypothetical protein